MYAENCVMHLVKLRGLFRHVAYVGFKILALIALEKKSIDSVYFLKSSKTSKVATRAEFNYRHTIPLT